VRTEGGCLTATSGRRVAGSDPRPADAGGWCNTAMSHGQREIGERWGLTGGPPLQSRAAGFKSDLKPIQIQWFKMIQIIQNFDYSESTFLY
jgi:hypothetical protein